MEGSNIVFYKKDGKEYRTCRECRNQAQNRYQRKLYAERRAAKLAAANARELAAKEAEGHCDHCRSEPRAIDIAYVSTLARVIHELGGTVPEAPDEVMRTVWTQE